MKALNRNTVLWLLVAAVALFLAVIAALIWWDMWGGFYEACGLFSSEGPCGGHDVDAARKGGFAWLGLSVLLSLFALVVATTVLVVRIADSLRPGRG